MTNPSLAEQFFARFSGLERAYGTYNVIDKSAQNGHKKEGKATTFREPPTVELWEKHLAGSQGLGIVPIREDSTVLFGAIDVDQYKGLRHAELAARVASWELPLIVCNTKSGGAHLYLFCREPIPAVEVRDKLAEWAIYLGFSGVEIFPKQVRLAGENDVGNWINMPYFGGAKTTRWGIFNGKRLDPKGFLKLSDGLAVDRASLKEIKPPQEQAKTGDLLEEGPPCLITLALRGGIDKGTRNNGLFNIGIYLRKRYGEKEWEKHLEAYNAALLKDPLSSQEVATIIVALNKKAYEYKCSDQPICDVCNKQVCYRQKYGVGAGEGDPGVAFGNLVKIPTDPVTWIWDVDGARIQLTTIELKDQARFHARAMEELNKWPNSVKPLEWAALVRNYLEKCEVMEIPIDARPEGQMWLYLEQYCTGTVRARNKEEMIQRKPWTDEGRVYFSGVHFQQWLAKQGIRLTMGALWNWLGQKGAQKHFFRIKEKGVNVWSVDAFDELDGDLAVPTIDNVEEM